MSILGDAIKTARQEAGLTIEQVAVELSVSARTVNRWESGDFVPHPFLLRRLEQLLPLAATKEAE